MWLKAYNRCTYFFYRSKLKKSSRKPILFEKRINTNRFINLIRASTPREDKHREGHADQAQRDRRATHRVARRAANYHPGPRRGRQVADCVERYLSLESL